MGFLPFALSFAHLNMAIISWLGWPGYLQGGEFSVLDALALALYLSLPGTRHAVPFRLSMVLYFVSTVISAFNSLTLSPALAAILLRPREKGTFEPLPWFAFVPIGAWLGPLKALYVVLLTGIAGGVMALVVMVARGYSRTAGRNIFLMVTSWRLGVAAVPGVTLADAPGPRLAYALPIAAGTVLTLWLY